MEEVEPGHKSARLEWFAATVQHHFNPPFLEIPAAN
jgi:hypothetical protein